MAYGPVGGCWRSGSGSGHGHELVRALYGPAGGGQAVASCGTVRAVGAVTA